MPRATVLSTSAVGIHRVRSTRHGRREAPSRPRSRGRSRTRGYPRSGGPTPGRPSRRRARRADRDAGRRGRRSRPRARAGRRTRDRAGRSTGLRLLTRNTDTERVPGGISPSSSPLATARDSTCSSSPPDSGYGNHNRGFRAGAEPDLELALARGSLPHGHLSLTVAAVRLTLLLGRARTRNRPSGRGPSANAPRRRRAC